MSEKTKPIFLVDIDGTLADLVHRLPLIKCEKPDWPAFFAACGNDDPIAEVIDTVKLLKKAGALIVLVSGRSETSREQTLAWLRKFKVPCDALYMREDGDHRQDAVIKSEFLLQIQEKWKDWTILGVFEDRVQCVEMYRGSGLQVYQVAEGNF